MLGKSKTKKVPFEFLAPDAQKVYLAGDFNNWDPKTNLMKKDKGDTSIAFLLTAIGRTILPALVASRTNSEARIA
jgi:1,4-alpha-glucan branching enzyme